MTLPINKIICGSAIEVLKTLPVESISCCISSPPYWGLRDYSACDCATRRQYSESMRTYGGANRTEGVGGNIDPNDPRCKKTPDPNCPKCNGTGKDVNVEKNQLGLEKTFEEYIDKLCTIYDEVKRVLRKDGTCFVNLGDTYAGGGRGFEYWKDGDKQSTNPGSAVKCPKTPIPDKSLCLIPQRFAIEMVNRGWILRNTLIWHKPNPMPSSAKDRFTVDFEYVYFFVKSRKYWFEPQYEPHARLWDANNGGSITTGRHKDCGGAMGFRDKTQYPMPNPLGRNKRCVWTIPNDDGLYIEDKKIIAEFTQWLKSHYPQQYAVWKIPTQSFPEAHFATYPEKLVEPMIKAGCPEFICTKCGKAREKVYNIDDPEGRLGKGYHNHENDLSRGQRGVFPAEGAPIKTFIGYTDCNCGAEFVPGVILDSFIGSGTTLQVAARLNRNYLGIELKPEYIEMAEKRTMMGETGIAVKEQNWGQGALFK